MADAVHLRRIGALAVVAAFFVGLVALSHGGALALLLAPAVAIALPLLFGRYPGERVIHRLQRASCGRRAPVRAARTLVPRRVRVRVASAGRLVALHLPGRAPPLVSLR